MLALSSQTARRGYLGTLGVAFALALLSGCERSGGDKSSEVSKQSASASSAASTSVASRGADDDASPVFDVTIPAGYRDWKLISVAHEEGNLNSLGAILGNDVAIKAYREATVPFPDGTIIAALHWRHTASEENNKVFDRPQSFVPGPATNVQFMVKDSKKYASTGGWGFAHFNERDGGKPGNESLLMTCYPCHKTIAKEHDLVFTRYSP